MSEFVRVVDENLKPLGDQVLPMVPDDVKAVLDSNVIQIFSFVTDCFNKDLDETMRPKWLDQWRISFGYQAALNAKRLKEVIVDNNFDCLDVQEQYLYHLRGQPVDMSNKNYVTLIKNLPPPDAKTLSQYLKPCDRPKCNLKCAFQLYNLALKAGHYDLHFNSYTVLGDRIMIHDTGADSMPDADRCKFLAVNYLLCGNRLHDEGGIRTQPDIINDPITRIELSLYSKVQHFDDKANSYIHVLIRQREELRQLFLNQVCSILHLSMSDVCKLCVKMMCAAKYNNLDDDLKKWVDKLYPLIGTKLFESVPIPENDYTFIQFLSKQASTLLN